MRYIVAATLTLALLLLVSACAMSVQAATHETMAPSVAAQYDANGNGVIDKPEAIAAITDYLFGG